MAKPVWPTIEETLMMRPDFCVMRCGTTARVVRKTPRRLMSRTRSNSSSVRSWMGAGFGPTPALLTRTSTRPNFSSVWSTRFLAESALRTSCLMPRWPLPSFLALSFASSSRMSASTTQAPWSATAPAMPSPMPRAPPVMMPTRFSRSPIAFLLLLVWRGCSNRGDSRVVRAEEVVRVVLSLDPCQAVVSLLATVGVDEAVGLVEVEHVGVDAGAEPGLQRLIGGTDLTDVACIEPGIIPVQREVEPPVVVAVRKGGGVRADASHRAAEADDLDLARHLHLAPSADKDLERLLGQLVDMSFLRVVAVAVGEFGVEQLLDTSAEGHQGHRLGGRLADGDEALHKLFALFLFRVGQVHDDHQEQALAAQGLGDEGKAGHRLLEGGVPPNVVGELGIDLRVLGKRLGRVLGMVECHADPHLGPELVGLELELGDGAEVAAATVQGPEEVGVLGLAGGDDLA